MADATDLGRLLVRRFGKFPERYCVFDLETTGLNTRRDLALEIGLCVVEGGNVVSQQASVLDWTRCDRVDQQWLRDRLADVAKHMEKAGAVSLSYEELAERGSDPLETLANCCDRLQSLSRRGYGIVFHNGIGYDWPLLDSSLARYCDRRLRLRTRFWDTRAVEVALALAAADDGRWVPGPLEKETEYMLRLTQVPGVKSSLHRYCVPRYGLEEQLAGLSFHTAGADALATHLVLQAQRRVLGLATEA